MQKFLDEIGVQHLWKQLSLEDYPNNATLIAVLNAIDETKADRAELFNEEQKILLENLIPSTIARIADIPVTSVNNMTGDITIEPGVSEEQLNEIIGERPILDQESEELAPATVTEMFENNQGRISYLESWAGANDEVLETYNSLSHYINEKDEEIKSFVGYDESLFDPEGNVLEGASLVEAINDRYTINQVNELVDNAVNEIQITTDSLSTTISTLDQRLTDDYYTKDEVTEYHTDLEEYTDHQIAALVNSAPETLDTIGELATAFEENADMVATLNAAVVNKAEQADLELTRELVDLNATAIEALQSQILPTTLYLQDAITGTKYAIQIQSGQLVSFEA